LDEESESDFDDVDEPHFFLRQTDPSHLDNKVNSK
jgi:hypothetical protein